MSDLQEAVDALPWFHSIDFGQGVLSKGSIPLAVLKAQADIYFAHGIAGKSFLDIGCWDGFNSFEALRRGASRVLATDHFAWNSRCWGDRRSFDLARRHVGPGVEALDIDLSDLTPEKVGPFDVVLFAGVFYHLRHPLLVPLAASFARIGARRATGDLRAHRRDASRRDGFCPPCDGVLPGAELGGDNTNWWGPNRLCVEAMLRDIGFPNVEFTPHPTAPRGIFRALR